MADSFIPQRDAPPELRFMPTVLVAALDAARRQAAAPPMPAAAGASDAEPIEPLLEEARRGGWEDGLAEGLRRAEAMREAEATRALATAAEALRQGEAAARAAATAVAQDLARLVLSLVDAALPGLAAEHAASLGAGFARRIAPVLDVAPEARLVVAAGLADPVRALLGATPVLVEEDAALAPGDARAGWRGGGAAFDLDQRRQAIRQVLDAAGLGPKE